MMLPFSRTSTTRVLLLAIRSARRQLIFLLLIRALVAAAASSDPVEDAICFGALHVDLPVRYLHIQLRHSQHNVTSSQGELIISVQGDCRFKYEQIDNFDGSYVLRIRLWAQCEKLTISIRSPGGTYLCDSPFTLRKENGLPLYSEFCDCPEVDLETWMTKVGCAQNYRQIDEDLKHWEEIDFEKVLKVVTETWGHPRNRYSISLCHYQVVDNEIYNHCFGEYTGFRNFVDEVLTSLSRKARLPNTDFMFNLGDYPLERNLREGVPIVGWCGSKDTLDVVMPTYELMLSVIDSMYKQTLDIHTVKGNRHWPWSQKLHTAVFRGRDSCQLRLDMAALSLERPELIDAGITAYFFFNESLHTPTVNRIPFSEFFKHRYVLSIDGTVAAYRFPFLLAGDSVVFKGPSHFYEHFYSLLQPGLHFIPFDLKNIIHLLEHAKHQNFNETIQHTKQFVKDHLQPLNLYCYYAYFLKEYSAKLKKRPERATEDMQRVDRREKKCDCGEVRREAKRRGPRDEEL